MQIVIKSPRPSTCLCPVLTFTSPDQLSPSYSPHITPPPRLFAACDRGFAMCTRPTGELVRLNVSSSYGTFELRQQVIGGARYLRAHMQHTHTIFRGYTRAHPSTFHIRTLIHTHTHMLTQTHTYKRAHARTQLTHLHTHPCSPGSRFHVGPRTGDKDKETTQT